MKNELILEKIIFLYFLLLVKGCEGDLFIILCLIEESIEEEEGKERNNINVG